MMQEYISKTWLLQQMETAPVVEFDTDEHYKLKRRAKWHPADERPPIDIVDFGEENGTEVEMALSPFLLVCVVEEDGKPYITIAHFCDYKSEINNFDNWFTVDGKEVNGVTHWRYMPHLPKEVDGDD